MKSDKPDPLAKFRRPATEVEKEPALNKEAESYAAFGGKDRVERLRIRRVLDHVRSPRYLHLHDITYDGYHGFNFVLYFEHLIVTVRGKNLQGLVAALENSTVDFIQEYHPEVWDKPADDAPIIESIEVIVRGERSGSEPPDGKKKH